MFSKVWNLSEAVNAIVALNSNCDANGDNRMLLGQQEKQLQHVIQLAADAIEVGRYS